MLTLHSIALELFSLFWTLSDQCLTTSAQATSTPIVDTYVFVGGDICQKERCTCNSQSYDCTGANIAKLISGSDDFTYEITLNLEPIEFTETSTIATFDIYYIGVTENTNNLNATQLVATDTLLNQLDSSIQVTSISPTTGEVSIEAQYGNDLQTSIEGNYGSTTLSITIDEDNQGYAYSVYRLEIDTCNNAETCTIVYPHEVYIVIENEMVTTSTENTSGGSGGSGDSSTGVTIGIIVTVLVVVLIAAVGGIYMYRKKRQSGTVSYGNNNSSGNNDIGKEKLIDDDKNKEDYNPPTVELNDRDENLYKQDEETKKVY